MLRRERGQTAAETVGDFEREILDEVNPGGWEGFLLGNPYWGVTLDENGELKLLPPPDEPPPAVDWDAARAALGIELPADFRALAERYGGGALAGLRLLVPGHPNRHVDLLRQVEPQRWALQYLIDEGIEQPYPPERLLPWGIDEGATSSGG